MADDRAGAPHKTMNIVLWILQGLLALLFLFAGVMKFFLPAAALKSMPFPIQFLYFIGVCEILGGLGLVLPGLLRTRTGLTPWAAAGLTIIMIGATVVTLTGGNMAQAILPLVTCLLVAFVAYARWRLAPLP